MLVLSAKICKIPAILGLILVLGTGCSMDKGSSGEIPRQNVFLEAEGCLVDNTDTQQAGTILFSFTAPFDLLQMEARLEVLRGDIDLVVGTEDPPSDYFSFGRGPGTQKVRVGRASHEPLIGRPWYVQLVSPFEIQECEEAVEPDWRLSVRRSSGSQGQVLLEQEVQVPACTSPGLCDSASIPLQVPEDALSMELVLESIDGDADLLVGAGDQTERWSSLNLGPGYDVVVIDPQAAIPLRGQELSIVLESWQETTNARLEVTYVPGEVDSETPPAL